MPIYGADGKVARFTKADYARDKAIVKKLANSLCQKCYGRGYLGLNITTRKLTVCKCVNQKELYKELVFLSNVAKRMANAS